MISLSIYQILLTAASLLDALWYASDNLVRSVRPISNNPTCRLDHDSHSRL